MFHPETIHLTNFGNAVGFLLVCAVLCVAAGHIIYRLSRQGFLQACALARQTTELAFLNGNLETRVAERTDDLRALAARLTTALEDERGRIAREIHDDLGQAVSAIRLEVEVAEAHLARADAPAATSLDDSLARVKQLVDETLSSSRRLLSQLRPRVLDDLGLCPAMRWLVGDFRARHGIACALRIAPETLEVDPDRALALFRILQECLTNVVRHARATHVDVTLSESEAGLHLRITDNGIGGAATRHGSERESGTRGSGVGMIGMRERALAFAGRFDCESPPRHGTHIEVFLPHRTAESTPAHGEATA